MSVIVESTWAKTKPQKVTAALVATKREYPGLAKKRGGRGAAQTKEVV